MWNEGESRALWEIHHESIVFWRMQPTGGQSSGLINCLRALRANVGDVQMALAAAEAPEGRVTPMVSAVGFDFTARCLFQDTIFLANQNAGLTSSICARVCLVLWNTCSILMWQICSSERWVSVGDIEVSSLNFRVTIFQRRYRFFSSTLREIMSNYVQRRSNM